jgi:branched-chain amino acid transport system substrate-binding protein
MAALVIGAILPLTGEAAHWGIPARDGATLAVEDINRGGGIAGQPLALTVRDDHGRPQDAVAAFERIAGEGALPAILGAVASSATLAVAPLAQAREIVLISPASTSPKVTEAGDFVFRLVPSGSLRAQVLADYVWRERGLRRVAALYIDNEGGVGGANAFRAQFSKLGGTLALAESYPPGVAELRAAFERIKAANVEGVIVGSYPPDTVVALKAAREVGLDLPLFFTTESPQNPQVLRVAGEAAEGAIYILAAPAQGEAPERFARAYAARFGHAPDVFAAEGYDIVRLIAAALGTLGAVASGRAIRDYLHGVKDYRGASGTVSFDRNGDVTKPYAINAIRSGVPVTLAVR